MVSVLTITEAKVEKYTGSNGRINNDLEGWKAVFAEFKAPP